MENFSEFYKRNHKSNGKAISFNDYLFKLMKEKHIEGSSLYTKGNIDRNIYAKLVSNQMEPSLNTAIKLALALHCNNAEFDALIKKLGYTLSNSSTFALVIRYCIENKIYDLYRVNDILIDHKCAPLDKTN